MRGMIHFLLAPLWSLFSPKFYRQLTEKPVASGFLYLAYLSLLLSVYGLLIFRIQFLPLADDLVIWAKENLPEMVLTRQGIQMKLSEPRLLTHPKWGALIYLDPARDFPEPADIEKAYLVVTRTQVGYRDPSTGQLRIQDLLPKTAAKGWRDATLTGNTVGLIWRKLAPWLSAIIFVSSFVGVYLWKLTAALGYSLAGLLLNRFRSVRLGYASILKLSLFAITPVTLLQTLAWQFPDWPIPLNFLTSFVVTTLYLALAILVTQPRNPQTV